MNSGEPSRLPLSGTGDDSRACPSMHAACSATLAWVISWLMLSVAWQVSPIRSLSISSNNE